MITVFGIDFQSADPKLWIVISIIIIVIVFIGIYFKLIVEKPRP